MLNKVKLLAHFNTLSFHELKKNYNTLKVMRRLAIEEKNDSKIETIDEMLSCISEAMLAKFK